MSDNPSIHVDFHSPNNKQESELNHSKLSEGPVREFLLNKLHSITEEVKTLINHMNTTDSSSKANDPNQKSNEK